MNFKEIFDCFLAHKNDLKVISVASADLHGKPNSAPKMLVDIVVPNFLFFLDYKFTQTYDNVMHNPQLSISFMDDASFTGYRLTGHSEIINQGEEYEAAKKRWDKRLISYEADRILKRMSGQYSTKDSESLLPPDFVIVKLAASEASVVKPGRIFRATPKE